MSDRTDEELEAAEIAAETAGNYNARRRQSRRALYELGRAAVKREPERITPMSDVLADIIALGLSPDVERALLSIRAELEAAYSSALSDARAAHAAEVEGLRAEADIPRAVLLLDAIQDSIDARRWELQRKGGQNVGSFGEFSTLSPSALSRLEWYVRELRAALSASPETTRCQAARDGECMWKHCPQLRDGEPRKTGRHCPLDNDEEER